MKKANLNDKNSSGPFLFSMTLILLVYFFFMDSKDIIINYPQNILYGTFFGLFLISSVFVIRKIIKSNSIRKQKDLLDKFIFGVMSFLKIAIITWFVAGILLIPLNYSIINYSKSQMSFIELVEIEQLISRGKDRIFFELNGRRNVIIFHKPIMNDIYKKKNHYNYLLELEIKESLLGSYVLINWDIIEKK